MNWYVVWKNDKDELIGFIEDEQEKPVKFKTEKDAILFMEDHILGNQCKYIEIN